MNKEHNQHLARCRQWFVDKHAARRAEPGYKPTPWITTIEVDAARLEAGIEAFVLFAESGLCDSRSAARRLIQQGGAYVNERRVEAFNELITGKGRISLRAGKNRRRIVTAKEVE